ncbi:uncharacterized protein LOC142224503 [Haematobia irritans]|uniref:uncharacterized protein LOC142224503 n=1 Tax=Haematobia irritans TaxID=7368 RepID=UPI003F4F6514
MAATLQHCNTATTSSSPLKSASSTSPNPQLKRLVYSKYRELLGSYNDQANAYIDTLPSYMVQKDNGFNLDSSKSSSNNNSNKQGAITTIHLTSSPSSSSPTSFSQGGGNNELYGSGQRMPGQSTYEAPACVQNAMTRDKKPFTYTPGGIDLSQIKSERMAKRLARNACAEGAAGKSPQNRPVGQPMSPGSPGSAAATIGAAAMGMPFQVLPPSPHLNTAAGKNTNGGSAPAPPPPPPPSSSNLLNTGSNLAPQMNGNSMNGARGSTPSSPNMQRKIPPAPPSQRFEPPPLGFRPEIKIPPNPMAGLRKVPPPVEKNTFWKDEYKKNKVGSDDVQQPRVVEAPTPAVPMGNSRSYTEENDSVNGSSSTTPQTNASNGTEKITTNGETNFKTDNSDYIDGFKKTMPSTTTNKMQANQTNNDQEAMKTPPAASYSSSYQDSEKPQQQKSPQTTSPDTQSITRPTPPTSPQQQGNFKPSSPSTFVTINQVERESATPPAVVSSPKPVTPPYQATHIQTEAQQKQQSPKPEFRSVAAASPQAVAVNAFNRQTDSPRSMENATPPRVTESPFRLAQQQRPAVAMSPLAQEQQMAPTSGATISPNTQQAQTVPWRTQRGQTPQQQAPPSAQSHPQPFYGSMPQQQQQRTPDFSTQTSPYQGPKPTNVGSLYIAPLAAPIEPHAQHIVRQQMQQQSQRDSPMRQMGSAQAQTPNQQLRWMSSQPKQTEQAPWARPEENGNVMPSSLNRMKSPPPSQQVPFQSQVPQPQPQQQQQQPYQQMYQPYNTGNGYTNQPITQNFGAHHNTPTGLRLQINTKSIQNTNNNNQSGPRERIIPIQLEQTPTYTPAQPSFNTPSSYGPGNASPGYVMRTPNQFVDQGYNNYGTQGTPQQQLNAPRMVQQHQQQGNSMNPKTHIVPIAVENNNEGTRGPISKAPIVIQNGNYNLIVHDCPLEAEIRFRKNRLSDLRTPPVQSKSFRILQKITDTDGNNDDSGNQQRNDTYMDAEPQLQRPTFARQMSAQQARNSPTVEQMRRMKIGHEQGNSTPQTPSQFNQQPRPFYNSNNDYVPPSEQQVPEPKKYTGSAIPSRSFKILQAMTQPENAGNHLNPLAPPPPPTSLRDLCEVECPQESNDDINDETKFESHNDSCASSSVEPTSSTTSMSSLSSTDSICSVPSHSSPSQPLAYPAYPYGYPWYPPPPPPHHQCALPTSNSGENITNPPWPYPYGVPASPVNGETVNPTNWPYPSPYGMPPPPPAPNNNANGENTQQPTFPPYPYYYPYYPMPPPMPPFPPHSQGTEYDPQNPYAPYMPPPPPYHAYPYPVPPNYSQTPSSSRASSVLPDIIITPSTDDIPSKVVLKHHIKVEKEKPTQKRSSSVDIEDVSSVKSPNPTSTPEGSIVDILTQHLQNMTNGSQSNPKTPKAKDHATKSQKQKPPAVQITMVKNGKDHEDSDSDSSVDSDATTKQYGSQNPKDGAVPLQSIKSVTNVQIYNAQESEEEEDDDDEDDDTTADGESDVFDEEAEEGFVYEDHDDQPNSECEEYIVDDGLSVIYEEESDFDKSFEVNRPLKNGIPMEELDKCIEENDSDSDDEANDAEENCDTNSVTVRLPLKFSFTKSTNSDPVTTVEVGKSSIEDRRNSITLSEKPSNSFKVATLDSESDSDSCEVSVTISLSSRSGSVDSKEGNRKNMSEKYPIEDMPEPEKVLPKITNNEEEDGDEDVSFSFSLNKRNKFVGQTLNGDLTNNIAQVEEEKPKEEELCQNVEIPQKEETSPRKQSTEELDFFATLMATKMQAQKIKEQSASYWGKSKDSNDQDTKDEQNAPANETDSKPLKDEELKAHTPAKETDSKLLEDEELKARTNFWAKYSTNKTSNEIKEEEIKPQSTPIEKDSNPWDTSSSSNNDSHTTTEETHTVDDDDDDIEDIWADREEIPIVRKDSQKSYWDNYSKSSGDNETESSKQNENNHGDTINSDEIEDIWANRDDDYTPVSKSKPEIDVQLHEEEVIDIWADRNEDVVAVKNLAKKIDSLETARDSFWSTVAEANKASGETQENDDDFWSNVKVPKRKLKSEIMTEISFNPTVLRYSIDELKSNSLKPSVHIQEEEEEEEVEEEEKQPEVVSQDLEEEEEEQKEDEVDFWAQIEEAKQESSIQDKDHSSRYEDPIPSDPVQTVYDPLKYPEEPREVDTDEEIDFWAELDANRLPDDADITFHRAATFWASRDRRNSIDETPYKPVLPKAFPAKIPDDPSKQDEGIWATLEAHKGEDPVIVDPLEEEEKQLAGEFDEMSQQPGMYEDEECAEPIETTTDTGYWNTSSSEPAEVYTEHIAPAQAETTTSIWPAPPSTMQQDLYVDNMQYTAPVQETSHSEVWNNTDQPQYYVDNSILQDAGTNGLWTEAPQQNEEPDFWAQIDKSKTELPEKEISSDKDDLEVKRNNYRKAMAFFTTSIDEPKEGPNNQTETTNEKSNRNSYINEEKEKSQASTQEVTPQLPQPEEEKKASKPPKKEAKSKSKSKSPKGKAKALAPNTNTTTELPEVYVEPTLDLKRLPNGLPDLGVNKFNEERKISVRDRISVFESGPASETAEANKNTLNNQSLSVDSSVTRRSSLSRNSSSQRSESEIEEDDSGVTDMNKLSETETESGSFPELRKMSSYQRAATHSRLFKLLQDDTEGLEDGNGDNKNVDEFQLRPSRRKVVHNVSITRKQNPKALAEVETMSQRRERLSLPLRKNTSIDADNPSTPNSPASPIMDQSANQTVVSDKLVSELVQSLLLKSDSSHLRKLPMEKLQAAAKRVLEEELDSLDNTSVDSTPSMTPNDHKKDRSYADYYNTWSDANGSGDDVIPSKSFKTSLQDSRRSPWTVRCPRVLSSKTINRDLARVTESPEIFMRSSMSPDCYRQSRENSVSRWRKT